MITPIPMDEEKLREILSSLESQILSEKNESFYFVNFRNNLITATTKDGKEISIPLETLKACLEKPPPPEGPEGIFLALLREKILEEAE